MSAGHAPSMPCDDVWRPVEQAMSPGKNDLTARDGIGSFFERGPYHARIERAFRSRGQALNAANGLSPLSSTRT